MMQGHQGGNTEKLSLLDACGEDMQELSVLAESSMAYASFWGKFVGCLMSQQHASVSLGRICTENSTCCHTEIEAADQTFYLTQSQYTDNGLTSPSADPIMPGTWQDSHWSANF